MSEMETSNEPQPLAPAAERVAAGIAWLDAQVAAGTGIPANWRELVNVEQLRMWDGFACVLGQIGGAVTGGEHYWGWVRQTYPDLTLNEDSAEALGFNLDFDRPNRDAEWKALQDAWKEALA